MTGSDTREARFPIEPDSGPPPCRPGPNSSPGSLRSDGPAKATFRKKPLRRLSKTPQRACLFASSTPGRGLIPAPRGWDEGPSPGSTRRKDKLFGGVFEIAEEVFFREVTSGGYPVPSLWRNLGEKTRPGAKRQAFGGVFEGPGFRSD